LLRTPSRDSVTTEVGSCFETKLRQGFKITDYKFDPTSYYFFERTIETLKYKLFEKSVNLQYINVDQIWAKTEVPVMP
jgi:predicted GNAT superfamily acetyltransferase